MMISLPSLWVKGNSIRKGALLDVEVQNNQLIIFSTKREEYKKAVISIKKKEEFMKRLILAPYREGCDELVIQYQDAAIPPLVRNALTIMLGFEIVDQTATAITIRNVAESSDENYLVMFRRQWQIMLTMAESCVEFLDTGNKDKLTLAMDLYETVLKLMEFNLRLVNKENSFSLQKKSLEFFYVWNSGVLAKMWSYIARHYQNGTPSLTNTEKRFAHHVLAYVRQMYTVYYQRELTALQDIRNKRYPLQKEGFSLMKKTKEAELLFHLLSISEKAFDISTTFGVAHTPAKHTA